MAAGYLRVTPETLERTAGSFRDSANTVKTLTDNMISLVEELTGKIWSGEAATAYVNKFIGLQGDMDQIYRMITEHVDDLTDMAQKYRAAEQKNEELANSLQSDVIS